MSFKTIDWKDQKVILIDQTKLPLIEEYISCDHWQEVATAIKDMIVRGAPAIGVTAALGYAQGALSLSTNSIDDFKAELKIIAKGLLETRPTAVNLAWAIHHLESVVANYQQDNPNELKKLIEETAVKILNDDIKINQEIGKHGAHIIEDGDTILTHCNAGALATAGFGTALGVIYSAHHQGKQIKVIADETRPFLQGARLTCWELQKNHIPTTLISDNMAGWLMKKGQIHKVVVGADRIAHNGDVANKIGTYMVASMAKKHHIPFYVAAPLSTIDLQCPTGAHIPIEERNYQEISHIQEKQICPDGIDFQNPAFDVTESELITGIITEKGIARAPFEKSLPELFK